VGVGEDLLAQSRALARIRERTVTGGPLSGIRDLMVSSWRALPSIEAALTGLGDDSGYVVAIGGSDANLLWVMGDPRRSMTCARSAMRHGLG
jgi:hypothetical protein